VRRRKSRGYTVEGFAPTSRAARQLNEAGVEAGTLQGFLAHSAKPDAAEQKHFYLVDESSLASTNQMREFLARLGPNDRVLLIGDTRQHQGVEAGRPFEQLQEAGMRTAKLDEIVRQKDPALKSAVELLAKGRFLRPLNRSSSRAVSRKFRMLKSASAPLPKPMSSHQKRR
jgi:ATP-dependent exoDNAse (exonuclease V) alpha subunit